MIKIFTTLVLCLLVSVTSAQSSVYEISKGGSKVYLGGTIHVLRASDYPLPQVYEQVYSKCQKLVFEADITSTPSQDAVLKLTSYQDERSLKSVLTDTVYSKLAEVCATNNLPLDKMLKMKPGMILTILTFTELSKAGVTTEGIDKFYLQKGIKDAKELLFLESVEKQLYLIGNMCEGNEDEFTLYSLEEITKSTDMLTELISGWKKAIAEYLLKQTKIFNPLILMYTNRY